MLQSSKITSSFSFSRKKCKMIKGPACNVKNREHYIGKSYDL